MENVKFVKCRKKEGAYRYFFRIHDQLADSVRENTCYNPKALPMYLTKGNLFVYEIVPDGDFAKMHDSFVGTVERISNSGDDAFFYNHLITDGGYHRAPREIHELMHNEFGLADVKKADAADTSDGSSDLEWWVAHFFIAFGNLIYGDPIEGEESQRHVAVDAGFVSQFLEELKNMDIVIVDDARKVGDDEMKEIREKLDQNEKNESCEARIFDMRTKDGCGE